MQHIPKKRPRTSEVYFTFREFLVRIGIIIFETHCKLYFCDRWSRSQNDFKFSDLMAVHKVEPKPDLEFI